MQGGWSWEAVEWSGRGCGVDLALEVTVSLGQHPRSAMDRSKQQFGITMSLGMLGDQM